MKKKQIGRGEWYGILDVARNGFFPWCANIKTVRNYVLADKAGKNVLKAVISGKGTNVRYLMRGENIEKFVAAWEKMGK